MEWFRFSWFWGYFTLWTPFRRIVPIDIELALFHPMELHGMALFYPVELCSTTYVG